MFKLQNKYHTRDGELGSIERWETTALFDSLLVLHTKSHCQWGPGLGACIGVPTNPYPTLVRDVLHQGFILGRGRCGNPVSPEKEWVCEPAWELSASGAACAGWSYSDAAESVGGVGKIVKPRSGWKGESGLLGSRPVALLPQVGESIRDTK